MKKKKLVIGWKKCFVLNKDNRPAEMNGEFKVAYVKLQILGEVVKPALKMRTSKAKVLDVRGLKRGQKAISGYHVRQDTGVLFIYTKGRIVEPTGPFNGNVFELCASGIHFFRTLKEARAYHL